MFDDDFDASFDPDGYKDYELESILGEKLEPLPLKKYGSEGVPSPRRLSTEELQRRCDALYSQPVKVMSDHKSYDLPVKVHCGGCGETVLKKPRGLMRGYWLHCKCKRPVHSRKSRKKSD